MGREYITFGFNICHDGNIGIIFIQYFVDENKYISGGSCYVLPSILLLNMAKKYKYKNININIAK